MHEHTCNPTEDNPRATLPERITLNWLRSLGACVDHIDIFTKEWPDGCASTAANLRRASAIGLDLDWFAKTILPLPAFEAFDKANSTAWKAFMETRAPACEAYEEAKATALIEILKLS